MAEAQVQRRLAAIMATDVVGYSRLIGADEVGTLGALKALRKELWYPKIAAHGGRVVKTTGDGELIEFTSIVEALECAVEMQRATARRNADIPEEQRIVLRLGLNLGDVIIDGDDIHGDGVNVAARLEALAEPGGICLSRMVRDAIQDKLNYVLVDMNEVEVKNIARPVHVFKVVLDEAALPGTAPAPASPLMLPDKPSIAVLPFENMSGDPEQDYFSDGITEDLITALSRIRWFFVIARNSTFAFKGKSVDVRKVARELGVRYVIEGSVRKAGNRVRLTAQLIDGPTGNHLWATRYDRDLEDIFAVQDELTQTVVGAIEPELSKAEQARAKLKKPENRGVWDVYLRGMSALNALTRESLAEAEQTFAKVIELDSSFAAAYSGLAEVYYYIVVLGLAADPDASRHAAFDAAGRAVELDREDAESHSALGRANLVNRKFDDAVLEFQAALEINPSHATAHYGLGATYVFGGKSEISLPHLEQAIRLSPHDAHMGSFLVRAAQAHLHLHDYEKAAEWARKALRLPNFQWSRHMILASALGHLGRTEAARAEFDILVKRVPGFSAAYMLDYSPMIENENFRHMVEGLHKAGLPE